jgi:hypothetical protein
MRSKHDSLMVLTKHSAWAAGANLHQQSHPDGVFGRQCVQRRLACSVGVSPTKVRVRSLVARVASVEETKRMKPTDKAILEMVSESPGRNENEPAGGLDQK